MSAAAAIASAPTASSPMLEVHGVTKMFAGLAAVQHVENGVGSGGTVVVRGQVNAVAHVLFQDGAFHQQALFDNAVVRRVAGGGEEQEQEHSYDQNAVDAGWCYETQSE